MDVFYCIYNNKYDAHSITIFALAVVGYKMRLDLLTSENDDFSHTAQIIK